MTKTDLSVTQLIDYALRTGLIAPCEQMWAVNAVLEALGLSSYTAPQGPVPPVESLSRLLDSLTDDAVSRGVLKEDSPAFRDLFDSMLMGRLTPRPAQVIETFQGLYAQSPRSATDWYYQFSQDTNYIRRDRIARDMRWITPTEYGGLDITINLSKPEKDPRAIAAARTLAPGNYPQCQLCAENEGYPGRLDHPGRSNHRIIPITINCSPWYFQYSPYVYYNEHCIVLNREHAPMKIDRACFAKLLDFVRQFPHYFVGSNADLPIVGGSILAHDHFQGGRYTFPMEIAPIEKVIAFHGFGDVEAGIVKWPLSTIRITSKSSERLIDLADLILTVWRHYSDRSAFIFAETEGEPHNTVTPIARMRDGRFELDLILRNNITTEEHPFGVYHPHAELHHIKKENIGLIEAMGLAVLPSRLRDELTAVVEGLLRGTDLRGNELTSKHSLWAEGFRGKYSFAPDNVMDIVKYETGLVFAAVLEHAGVFKRTKEGETAFLRFIANVNNCSDEKGPGRQI